MKLKKIITNSLILSIVLSNTFFKYTNSLANTQLGTRYENIQGASLSIENLIKGMETSFEVEGNTLINIFDYSQMNTLTSTPNDLGFSINGKTVTRDYTMALGNPLNTSWNSIENVIKNGETYTFVLDVVENTMDNGVEIFPNVDVFTEWFKGNAKINKGYTGKVIVSFKAKTDYQIKLLYRHFDHIKSGLISISNIMLLKGDYYDKFTNKNATIPKYFEGAKSVGEDTNTIEIKSENKNLLNINDLKVMNYSFDLPFRDDSLGVVFNVSGDTISYSTKYRWNVGVGGVYKVKKNTLYTAKYEEASCSKDYGMNINIIGLYEHELNDKYWYPDIYQNYNTRMKRLTKQPTERNVYLTYDSNDYDYLAIYIGGSWKDKPTETRNITLKNVGIYETGNSDVEYERYNSNKIEIGLKEPLKGILGGAKDKITKKSGKWYIERNVGFAILDGSEDWLEAFSDGGVKFFEERTALNNKHFHKPASENLLCSKLLNNKIYIATTFDGYKDFSICLNLNNTSLWRITTTQDMSLSEFKSWLSTNKPKVYYELETPIYELIDTDLSIYLYEYISYVTTSSIIPANIKIVVDRILNRVVESINACKENPSIENISIARMWVNLMDESIYKDSFQDEINNIIHIEDLEIERKKASANLDLYIKTKNTLSLSLDTNSITFDNYSGVEDMELLSAVNLTVNSSLPYSLNAYMEEGFYNSDKTNSLEVNSLNIRENTDTTYKQFTNIKEKVVLKDNCDEGNEKYHTIDFKLNGNNAHKTDVYKTVIKFEVEQK